MTRAAGKTGDTGLEWKGWHRSASESLLHATVDDDPRCVGVFAQEAIQAGSEALKAAKNQRQVDVTHSLLTVAHKIKDQAKLITDGMMEDEI